MNDYQRSDKRFYVYQHVDPDTGEVVYVGMGQAGRAWTFGNSGKDSAQYGHRSQEHYNWFVEKERTSCVSELVVIWYNFLTREEALKIEKETIEEFSPRFNKSMGEKLLKITPEDFDLCKRLRDDGLSYKSIADEINVAAMTVYRALNNQTKNIGEDY